MVEPIRPQDAASVYQRQIGEAAAASGGPRRTTAGGGPNTPRVDSVSVSERALLVHQVLQNVDASDVERAELVDALRSQLDAGTYEIDAREIARRMVEGQTS